MYHEEYEDAYEHRAELLSKYNVLTPADIMEILRIGKNSVYDLLNSGTLKGFRVGRRWRIPLDNFNAFMLGDR